MSTTGKLLTEGATVPPPAVSRMIQFARQSGRDLSDVVRLVRGEPDFTTPSHICEAARAAIHAGYTHYPPIQGYPDLREAIADRMRVDYQWELDPDRHVLVTSGATMGMHLALCATVRPNDEVLIPEPSYDAFVSQVMMRGATPVPVPADQVGPRFALSVSALERARTSRTSAIILNTPWNPTGTVMSYQELKAIGDFAVDHGLYLIIDEIYEKLTYDGHVHVNLASRSPDLQDRIITINSFSKTYAMTGWRLGYNFASPQLTDQMLMHYRQCSRGASAFVQQAGLAAINGPQEPVEQMVAEYTERRKLIVDAVSQIDGLSCLAPEGTFFCLVDAQALAFSSEELAHYLLRDWGLLVVPGAYYGAALQGFLRVSFSYAREDIQRGMERLADGVRQLVG